jgi:hypothetical protein
VIFARILFLLGSVMALFGLWRFIAPHIYETVSVNVNQSIIFVVIGGAMLWIGYQMERRNNNGSGHDK